MSGIPFSVNHLLQSVQRPPCFEPDTLPFWEDAYIAGQMLKAHLDPTTDAASRKPETIDRTVSWINQHLNLPFNAALLDLGCGPGLYCTRFAELGYQVTGMDISENSLRYARQHDPRSSYLHASYLTLNEVNRYDAAVLIYGDIGVLNDTERDTVLHNVHRALKPGGWFVFDVQTPHDPKYGREAMHWWVAAENGFWKAQPHLGLLQQLHYADESVGLERYFLLEDSGTFSEYRIWTHYYTLAAITAVVEAAQFEVVDYHADLTGTRWHPEAEWIGLVVRRA